MSEIKSIVWGSFVLLIMVAWISHGCRGRFERFQDRREERQERWEEFRERDGIIDKWRQRRGKGEPQHSLSN